MRKIADFRRLVSTARFLRPRQIWHQASQRIRRPKLLPRLETSPKHAGNIQLVKPIERRPSFAPVGEFTFLNRPDDLGAPIDWDAGGLPLLWRYNLHYFDYLQQAGMDRETGFSLMRDWSVRHPPVEGAIGWQPYVLSLRIVNWLKFMSAYQEFPPELVESLALQAENLQRQIEYHLLGNHLFANGKALWFAGLFLNRNDWVTLGRSIILDQVEEQFLPDGGHFELSPMYHAIAVEDLLDLVNLTRATGDLVAGQRLGEVAARALGWLEKMSGQGNRLRLLNDSAEGIAPTAEELQRYGLRLDLAGSDATSTTQFLHGWHGRNLSGYWVLENGPARLLFDTAVLGPDYLPGHAHCDMLSILFDYGSDEILSDTGVFEYAESDRRTYSRSTRAHNTVSIDDLEQGEIWKSFRLGRRGHPKEMEITRDGISCAHDGYSKWRNGLLHRRSIVLLKSGFEVKDTVRGPGKHRFEANYHFAPGIKLSDLGESRFAAGSGITFELKGGSTEIITSEFYPQFGLVQERLCLRISGDFEDEVHIGLQCTFSS